MDNGTMVDVFKHLNYMQLAKSSLVSKRFRDLIHTHRHSLARLYVAWITMIRMPRVEPILLTDLPAYINIFNKSLSAREYNEWVVRKQYSKQIPFERQPVLCSCHRRFYHLTAYADHNAEGSSYFRSSDPSHAIFPDRMTVFNAHAELNNENWPLFQHFVRLITDPFIYVGRMELTHQNDVLNLCRGSSISRAEMGAKLSSLLDPQTDL
ncbi:hypothetical protein Ddc_18638 [Ditylenchus destructor]|nr:hypothetical protein Ddc_18638 [Ditylenchus destructor]